MLNSRQRAQLRAMANKLDTILQIGKEGVTTNAARQCTQALTARELIKCRVLPGSGMTAREAADELSRLCLADTVHTIGTRFVLYKENREIDKDKRIKLVK
ncbi:MAG: YhbY family RNA-binding protein [Oscillospiraceae bacterium]|nr:YhbY family RNA-binding protein [Oscillospiraceae bacterium]